MLSIIFLLGTLTNQLQLLQSSLPPNYSTTTSIVLEAPNLPQVKRDILFERIALCESNNIATAKNKGSTASGRFQFIKSTWNHYGKELWGDKLAEKDVFDYEDNTELALYVYTKYGTNDWNESKPCWSSPKKE